LDDAVGGAALDADLEDDGVAEVEGERGDEEAKRGELEEALQWVAPVVARTPMLMQKGTNHQ
jgi:hypothetical protein